jgi:tRNA (guanine37-N1)-methyltransferase
MLTKINFKIFTIFPEIFPGCLNHSITGLALKEKIWQLEVINIRNYANDKHKTVDDEPYGHGSGMVLKPDVIGEALEQNLDLVNNRKKTKIIYLSPRGKVFNQKMAQNLANEQEIAILCGRYE